MFAAGNQLHQVDLHFPQSQQRPPVQCGKFGPNGFEVARARGLATHPPSGIVMPDPVLPAVRKLVPFGFSKVDVGGCFTEWTGDAQIVLAIGAILELGRQAAGGLGSSSQHQDPGSKCIEAADDPQVDIAWFLKSSLDVVFRQLNQTCRLRIDSHRWQQRWFVDYVKVVVFVKDFERAGHETQILNRGRTRVSKSGF